MKKIIFSAAVMVSAFFAASCQQEMLETQAGSNTVTYTVDVPNAIATKAIGDQVTAVDKVYYEVYRAAEVEDLSKSPVYQGEKPVINNSASFDLEFVKNQEFVVLFWAQNSALVNTDVTSEEGMYNINDLRQIQLVNPGAANNDAAQVFAGSDRVSNCASAANGNVTLTRPVSQINVYTTAASLIFGDVTISLEKSSMTVAGLYNTYNVAAGNAVEAAANMVTFEYTSADVPNATADDAALRYVGMNYVGFAPKAGTTVTVDFAIKTNEVEAITHSVSNVPVKPNYRTNIFGNLISATANYNVSLNDNWLENPDVNTDSVTVPADNTEDVVLSTETIEVTVPAEDAEAGATYKIVVSNESTETDNATGATTVGFDLTMYKNNEKVSGDVVYEITKNIGTDLFISEVTHNGTAMTPADTGADQTYTYDSTTGELTIYTKSFSPFAVTYANYKDEFVKLNRGHNKNSTISVSGNFSPIVAVNPEIYGYSVYDGDTRIANEVHFQFAKVKKETINKNSYKVSFELAIKDENGNELEIKDGRMNPYITTDPREHLHVYMNLIEVPEGYSVSEVKVGGTSLTLTANPSGDCATGEYWIGSDPKDLYFQSRTAGLVEVVVKASQIDYAIKLNAGYNKNSTISVSTGADFLPIVAVNPEIYGYSVYDGDTRIANAVTFRFSKVNKENINENSYKVSFNLAVLDENGNELEIKDGRMNQYITTDPREHLHVYMNLIEVPEGYSVSEVKVGGTSLTLTANPSGDCATGEYWIGSDPNDLYFQSRTAGLVEVIVAK